jgi:apolipoprotein N-acyltransferase
MILDGRAKAGGGKHNSFFPIWLALGTGVLLFLSFPGAAGLWPLAWVALVPLLLALKNVRPGVAARLGLLAGMVHYVSLLYWIIIVLGKYGNLPLWVSLPALLLLSLYMSSYLALFCALISRVWKQREISVVWVAPLLWVGLDFVRSFLFSGFPWQDLGYSQYKALLLIQIADLTGHFGITFHIVLVNSVTALLLVLWFANRSAAQEAQPILTLRLRRAWIFAILPALCLIIGVLGYNYTKLSEQAAAQENGPPVLLVWPETALPFLIKDNPYYRRLKDILITKQKIWLLSGAPFYKKVEGKNSPQAREVLSYNSAYLFTPEGKISGRYDKQHLVPFGEYVPLMDYLSLPGPLVENIGNFSSGKPSMPLSCQGAAIGVLICFESIFPKLARDWTSRGANLLVNITNDAWFGRSSAPWQHLSMAVFRAVENRRSLARSANTGVSAIINPLGRIIGASPLFQPFYLVKDVSLLQEKTIFVDFGHYFGLLCLLISVPVLLLFRDAVRQET